MPSSHIAPPTIQSQYWVPLPHCQRPVTRYPSPSRTPRALGANTPPVGVTGVGNTVRATSGARNAAIDDVVDAIPAHQPAAPSPTATAITESIRSTGPRPGPPYAVGRHKVSSPASCKAATVTAGNRRRRSASSACSRAVCEAAANSGVSLVRMVAIVDTRARAGAIGLTSGA